MILQKQHLPWKIKLFQNCANRAPKDNTGIKSLNFFICYVGRFQNIYEVKHSSSLNQLAFLKSP